jgi:hypothetical protein
MESSSPSPTPPPDLENEPNPAAGGGMTNHVAVGGRICFVAFLWQDPA